jgi:hypothetical protein
VRKDEIKSVADPGQPEDGPMGSQSQHPRMRKREEPANRNYAL